MAAIAAVIVLVVIPLAICILAWALCRMAAWSDAIELGEDGRYHRGAP